MFINFYLFSKNTTTSRGDRYFKHTKENISEAILAQLEKNGKLVKSFLWQLTQDQDKNSRAYYDKTFYIAKCSPEILGSSLM